MSQKNASPDCFSGQKTNIARGTTDPGYRVFSLNYLVDLIEFVSFLAVHNSSIGDLVTH